MTKLDLYNKYRNNIENVYEIFVSVFKKPYVELQLSTEFSEIAERVPNTLSEADNFIKSILKGTIIVWFPKVTVENEYGKKHDIYDLFVRIGVTSLGRMENSFEIMRTSFSIAELKIGYVHSHTPSKISASSIKLFDHVCLGTGPIRNTISRLRYDNDENLWLLFCTELGLYVRTESLAGGPYIRMSQLGNGNLLRFTDFNTPILCRILDSRISKTNIKEAAKLLLEKGELKFSYYKNRYCLGETFNDVLIKTGKLAKDFPVTTNVTFDGKDFKKYEETDNAIPEWFRPLNDTVAFMFNEKEIKFKVIDSEEKQEPFEVIHPDFIREALNIILLMLNNYYKNDANDVTRNNSSTEEAQSNRKHIKYKF